MLETMKKVDVLWDDNPVNITQEANLIWSTASKLRGVYMPDKYGDVIIPMSIIRRLECALQPTKAKVVETFNKNPNYPAKAMYKISGYSFYNSSSFDLAELCNDSEHIAANFKSYISGFSSNVQDILKELEMDKHIDKMNKENCLFQVVKAFSELDLRPEVYDSIKMGYIFENLIGRFYQNVDAGQYYTGRDIVKLLVSVLISEGCDDIFDDGKVITVCDQACGTGGMLSTAYSYLKHYNPTADVKLFGQEYMGQSYAIGLAEMLIKGQDTTNFRNADTFKEDCFADTKMRFVIENPPFGTPWAGKDAKDGQEEAVKAEHSKDKSRWGAGLPSGGDSQLLFIQSAIAKMDDKVGRATIIENGSPLFSGGTASGESQIRRWLLEQDYLEAIIQLPTDLFYNTEIATYIWVLSKNKREERKGKIQLIDASNIYHKLNKGLGKKKNEILPDDRAKITELYASFKENENCKIFDRTEFMYREYSVMQPLQRSYAITKDRIENMLQSGALNNLYDEAKVYELENLEKPTGKDVDKLNLYRENKFLYDNIIKTLEDNISDKLYMNPESFTPVLREVLDELFEDKTDLAKYVIKISKGLSKMDKNADIQKDKKGEIIYDTETKDIELVPFEMTIDEYMEKEVLPYIPDAKAFWEEKIGKTKSVIKTGAEIPFTRYFYKYQEPTPSKELKNQFVELEKSIGTQIYNLFGEI